MLKRKLVTIESPLLKDGFLGKGHKARAVISGDFTQTDPFITMMDDILDKQDTEPVGSPHPHAGFETVTLMLAGELGDATHTMKSGDFQIMTAGSGIIHTETIDTRKSVRFLQLWLNLPKHLRWVEPRVQDLTFANTPSISNPEIAIRVYSGALAGLVSPILNYTPLIVGEFHLSANIKTCQQLPANFNTFLYMLKGTLSIGDSHHVLNEGEVGWLDKFSQNDVSELEARAGENGAHFILFAAFPTADQIVMHGPFVGDSPEDIKRLYEYYHAGKLKHIANIPNEQRLAF